MSIVDNFMQNSRRVADGGDQLAGGIERLYPEWHLLKPEERAHIFGRARERCDEALSAMDKTSVYVYAFVVRCDRGDSQHGTVRSG